MYYNNFYQNIGNSLVRVTGMDGAKAYQMSPNSTAALFDASEDLMYIKSTDGAGFPTIRVFRFEEVKQQQYTGNEYVSRKEFEELREEIRNYGKQFVSESTGEQYTAAGNGNGKRKES